MFDRRSERLFTCSRSAITCWNLNTWEKVFELPATTSSAMSMIALSRSQPLAAVFSENDLIRLIHSESGKEICTLTPPSHLSDVSALCFSPDGRFLAGGVRQRGACVWDLEWIRSQLRLLGLDWDLSAETRSQVKTQSPASL